MSKLNSASDPKGAPWLRCLECGYDLRGLPDTGCPECGTPFSEDALRTKHRSHPVVGLATRVALRYFAFAIPAFFVFLMLSCGIRQGYERFVVPPQNMFYMYHYTNGGDATYSFLVVGLPVVIAALFVIGYIQALSRRMHRESGSDSATYILASLLGLAVAFLPFFTSCVAYFD